MTTVIAIQDAAREFGISRDTLDRLAERGKLKKYKQAGDKRVFVDRDQVKAALGFQEIRKD